MNKRQRKKRNIVVVMPKGEEVKFESNLKGTGFVIKLSSSSCSGYWSGKQRSKNKVLTPIIEENITENTKVYMSEKRAQIGLERCLEHYANYNGTIQLL